MNAAAPWLLPTNGRITVTVKPGIGAYTRFRTLPAVPWLHVRNQEKRFARGHFAFAREEKRFPRKHFAFARQEKRFAREHFTFARQEKRFAREHFAFARQEKRFAREHFAFARQEKRFAREHFAFARQEKRFAREHFAFARQEKRFACERFAFARQEKRFAREHFAFAREQKRFACERFAFARQEKRFGREHFAFAREQKRFPRCRRTSVVFRRSLHPPADPSLAKREGPPPRVTPKATTFLKIFTKDVFFDPSRIPREPFCRTAKLAGACHRADHRRHACRLIQKIGERLHEIVGLNRTTGNVNDRKARVGSPVPSKIIRQPHAARWISLHGVNATVCRTCAGSHNSLSRLISSLGMDPSTTRKNGSSSPPSAM